MMYQWNIDKACELIEEERISHIGGAPVQILDFFNSPRFAEADTTSQASFGIGGAATPPRIREYWHRPEACDQGAIWLIYTLNNRTGAYRGPTAHGHQRSGLVLAFKLMQYAGNQARAG